VYFISILDDLLYLLTDGMHKNNFHQLGWLLFELIKSLNQIQIQIFE